SPNRARIKFCHCRCTRRLAKIKSSTSPRRYVISCPLGRITDWSQRLLLRARVRVRESGGIQALGAVGERRLDLGKELHAPAVNAISSPNRTAGASTYPRLRSKVRNPLVVAVLILFFVLPSGVF